MLGYFSKIRKLKKIKCRLLGLLIRILIVKLQGIVYYLLKPDELNEILKVFEFSSDYEVVLIYLVDSLSLESEIMLFDIEETGDRLLFEKNNRIYHQLFPFEHAADIIEFDLNLKNNHESAEQIAAKLLDYRLKDA